MSQQQLDTIFVSNLPFAMDAQQLIDTFSRYGGIREAKIIKDPHTGRSKGFGFVTFDDPKSAKDALTMNGNDLQGRNIRVDYAKTKQNKDRGDRDRGDR